MFRAVACIITDVEEFVKALGKYYGVEAQINNKNDGQIEIMLSDNNSKKQIIVYMNADKYGVYFNQ